MLDDGFTFEIERVSGSQRKWRNDRFQPRRRALGLTRGGIRATLLDQPLCAIDGEGRTSPDGKHHYTHLQATWPNGGQHGIRGTSLTSKQCLDFLLTLPEGHTYVIYGGSYDMNMWLRDLPTREKDRLLDTGKSNWGGYNIRWIERKRFSVSKGGRSVVVYDVIANWQSTFVKACANWHVGSSLDSDYVAAMKEERGNFARVSDDDIARYCYLECDMLRELCSKLFTAIKNTPYRPRAVYGPGALAAAALEREGVKKHLVELPSGPSDPSVWPVLHPNAAAYYAYFGGRFDCSMLGWFTDVWQYDIKSAYPDQIRYLPCLKHATWRATDFGEVSKYGMYNVEWDVPDDTAWAPFPFRTTKGTVYYPYHGQGIYHGDEVMAARELFGSAIIVRNGWTLEPGCDEHPFAFVDALFQQRKAMEYGQGIVIKLILNSLYGKLAQQVGERKGKKPPFQCFYWAGAITAGTRAKIMRGLLHNRADVIGIATDSLVSLRELDLPIGGELGEWEVKELATYAQISNGIYHAVTRDGSTVERSRGFERSTLDWEEVKRVYTRSHGGGIYEFMPKARFVTLREGRQRTDRRNIECRWIGPGTPNRVNPERINFFPSRRFPDDRSWDRSGPNMRIEPIGLDDFLPEDAPRHSSPIRMKASWSDVHDARAKYHPTDWQSLA